MDSFARRLLPAGFVAVTFMVFPWAWHPFHLGKWLAVYFLATLATVLCFWRGVSVPRMPRAFALALGALAASFFASVLWLHPEGRVFAVLDRLSFLVLAFFAWRVFRARELDWEDFRLPVLFSLLGVSCLGLWQVGKAGFSGEMPYAAVGSSFGYANITAEFVAISLLLLFGLGLPKGGKLRAFTALTFVAALSYLFLLRGRSVLLGFGLALLVLLYQRFASGRLKLRSPWLWGAGGAVSALVILFQIASGKGLKDALTLSMEQKPALTPWRLDLWRQTLRMIADNPFGVGADRFDFASVPYTRFGNTLTATHVATSPHNDFLRYLAEDGLPLGVALFAFFAVFLVAWWRRARPESRHFFLPLCVFYAAESFFQFPWQLAFPVYFGAIALGKMGAELWPEERRLPERWGGAVLSVILFVQLLFGGEALIARTFENSGDPETLARSCRLVPANWRACLKYARAEVQRGELASARQAVSAELERAPWNFHAWKIMAQVAGLEGNRLEGCFYLWRYVDLFGGKVPEDEMFRKLCPEKWINYFERKRPTKYYPRGTVKPRLTVNPSG